LKRDISAGIEEKMLFGCFGDLEMFDIERRNVGLILELIKNLFMKLPRIVCDCIEEFRNNPENRPNVCSVSIYWISIVLLILKLKKNKLLVKPKLTKILRS
jgi:hypothetical protein